VSDAQAPAADSAATAESPVPLTGAQFEISGAGYRAVATGLGGGLRLLDFRGQPILAGYDADELPPGAAGQLLAPWPNRISGGSYAFDGTSHQLDISEPAHGNAIHGLTRWATWQVTAHTADTVTLTCLLAGRPGYPFCIEMSVRYRVGAGGLTVTTTARNAGTRRAPYGTGQHPYLTAGGRPVDDCELALPASRWLPADERGIPCGAAEDVTGSPYDFRQRRRIGGARLDLALTGLADGPDGRVSCLLRCGGTDVTLWAGGGYRWLQVFTGDTLARDRRRQAIAIEPMTCPPDAFRSGTDLLVLNPGASVTHEWGISVARR
jgi:aldose 1-epimerase